jgi:hypothetical protein
MDFKKYKNKLEWDTSIDELNQYLTGELQLNNSITKQQKKYLKDFVIPHLIRQAKKENEIFARELLASPLMKLAHHYCYIHQKTVADIFDVASEIINRINKDDKDVAVKQRLTEYCKRTRNA